MYSDREILLFLQHVPGIGNRTIQKLWHYFSTGEQIYTADETALKEVLNASQIYSFFREREKETPRDKLVYLEKKGISYYSIFDWQYPRRLRGYGDAPLALFVKGSLPPETEMTAAVVGARYHSLYGQKQTRAYAALLAEKNIGIVSGMAKGIDGIAQFTAIENGGRAYAVLGCGVNICYPKENQKLYDILPEYGGLISEYLPDTMPKASLFPPRNRIISGLGDILLVMEAKEKSGTLITVDSALEQGKEIWALPGRTEDALSRGCNQLIFQGAGILTGVSDFAKELDMLKEKFSGNQSKNGVRKQETTSGIASGMASEVAADGIASERAIVSMLTYKALSLEGIFERLQKEKKFCEDMEMKELTIADVSMLLMDLCMKNKIRQIQGGFYVGMDTE